MSKKLNAKFNINGLEWELVDNKGTSKKLQTDPALTTLGKACNAELKIRMHRDLDDELYKQSLIHELVHAFIFSYGVHIPKGLSEDELEEIMCDFYGSHGSDIMRIANTLYEMHLENKAKYKY